MSSIKFNRNRNPSEVQSKNKALEITLRVKIKMMKMMTKATGMMSNLLTAILLGKYLETHLQIMQRPLLKTMTTMNMTMEKTYLGKSPNNLMLPIKLRLLLKILRAKILDIGANRYMGNKFLSITIKQALDLFNSLHLSPSKGKANISLDSTLIRIKGKDLKPPRC